MFTRNINKAITQAIVCIVKRVNPFISKLNECEKPGDDNYDLEEDVSRITHAILGRRSRTNLKASSLI